MTNPLTKALTAVMNEHARQKIRYDPEHDDAHTDLEWEQILIRLARENDRGLQSMLARVAATAIAALEASYRKEQA